MVKCQRSKIDGVKCNRKATGFHQCRSVCIFCTYELKGKPLPNALWEEKHRITKKKEKMPPKQLRKRFGIELEEGLELI